MAHPFSVKVLECYMKLHRKPQQAIFKSCDGHLCGLSAFTLCKQEIDPADKSRSEIRLLVERLFSNQSAREGFFNGFDGDQGWDQGISKAYDVWYAIGADSWELVKDL